MIPTEALNPMGFGNLGMTVAYLDSTKKVAQSASPEKKETDNKNETK